MITKPHGPGIHALTIANERGIICVAGEGRYDPNSGFSEAQREIIERNRFDAQRMFGATLAMPPQFDSWSGKTTFFKMWLRACE